MLVTVTLCRHHRGRTEDISQCDRQICLTDVLSAAAASDRQSDQISIHQMFKTGLTLAGISVASFSWSPGQVVVEILTPFTVQTFGVVVTHAVTVNLKTTTIHNNPLT